MLFIVFLFFCEFEQEMDWETDCYEKKNGDKKGKECGGHLLLSKFICLHDVLKPPIPNK